MVTVTGGVHMVSSFPSLLCLWNFGYLFDGMEHDGTSDQPPVAPQRSIFGPIVAMRGATVPPNTVHLNGCLDACSKADAWEEALALFGSLEVQARNWQWRVWIRIDDSEGQQV